MRFRITLPLLLFVITSACSTKKEVTRFTSAHEKGTFGYDLDFLKSKDQPVVLTDGTARVIVSPRYQGKVFTSTADGESGRSFGWINYAAFDKAPDPHMNAYGGENRLWLGPEGNRFSLFFKPGADMVFDNWKTPAAFDSEPWRLAAATDSSVSMTQRASLVNYSGTSFNITLQRRVEILRRNQISTDLGLPLSETDKVVAYATYNEIHNSGDNAWTQATGAPCIWILDMFNPAPGTRIIVPFRENGSGEIVTSDYFGQIPPERLSVMKDLIVFTADGQSRGKIGVSPRRALPVAASINLAESIMTVVTFDLDTTATYLNQEWNTRKPAYQGDAVNAYNDGPLADGSQMGPFYELESVSPAAFLNPGQKLSHRHTVYHIETTPQRLRFMFLQLFPNAGRLFTD